MHVYINFFVYLELGASYARLKFSFSFPILHSLLLIFVHYGSKLIS